MMPQYRFLDLSGYFDIKIFFTINLCEYDYIYEK